MPTSARRWRSEPVFSVSLIVARARNGIIGNGNRLVWHLPEELRQFRSTTMHHALIVGRKTWESIGRPLPGRRMIVVSGRPSALPAGCEPAASLIQALLLAQTPNADHPEPRHEIFVAGGAQIYRQALPYARRLLVTQVELEPPGDVSFPWPLAPVWHCERSTEHRSSSGIAYRIEDWRRESPGRNLPAPID